MNAQPIIVKREKKFGGGILEIRQKIPFTDAMAGEGTIQVTVRLEKGIFSHSVIATSKFTGRLYDKSDDEVVKGSLDVSPRVTRVHAIGAEDATIDRVMEKITAVPDGVMAKGDDFSVSAIGPLMGVIAFFRSRVNPIIGKPALDLIVETVTRFVAFTGPKAKGDVKDESE